MWCLTTIISTCTLTRATTAPCFPTYHSTSTLTKELNTKRLMINWTTPNLQSNLQAPNLHPTKMWASKTSALMFGAASANDDHASRTEVQTYSLDSSGWRAMIALVRGHIRFKLLTPRLPTKRWKRPSSRLRDRFKMQSPRPRFPCRRRKTTSLPSLLTIKMKCGRLQLKLSNKPCSF